MNTKHLIIGAAVAVGVVVVARKLLAPPPAPATSPLGALGGAVEAIRDLFKTAPAPDGERAPVDPAESLRFSRAPQSGLVALN